MNSYFLSGIFCKVLVKLKLCYVVIHSCCVVILVVFFIKLVFKLPVKILFVSVLFLISKFYCLWLCHSGLKAGV